VGTRHPLRLLAVALALATLGAAAFVLVRAGSGGPSRANRPPPMPAACSSTRSPSHAASPAAAAPASRAALGAELKSLKLVSYYPADAAWADMWTDWQPARIGRDLCGIAALGANAVRVIVQPQAFGFPTPGAQMVDRLDAMVDLAAARGLRVQLTLFDRWHDYTDFQGSDTWSRAVLAHFRGDPRIVFCELQNEIDPGDASAMAWARHELPVVRSALRSIPITVSVSANSPVASVIRLKSALGAEHPDFYDVHYYGSAGAAFALFSRARSAVAPAPLFIGETGASSNAARSPAGDADQDIYLRTVEWAAQRAGLPLAAPWMFTDLAPSAVPAVQDPIDPDQRYFGLLRADGTAKPAARSIEAVFTGQPISTAFDNTFGSGYGGLPDGWQATEPAGGSLTWDGTVGHGAPGSAKLSGTVTGADPIPAFYTTPVVQPTRQGETFRLSAWVGGVGATGTNRVAISWFADDNGFVRESDSPAAPHGSFPWTELTVTAQVPPGAAYAEVRLQSDGNSGTVWFDDVSFTPRN
jgi:Cellulase (glycosyl hydrolase family 5)